MTYNERAIFIGEKLGIFIYNYFNAILLNDSITWRHRSNAHKWLCSPYGLHAVKQGMLRYDYEYWAIANKNIGFECSFMRYDIKKYKCFATTEAEAVLAAAYYVLKD